MTTIDDELDALSEDQQAAMPLVLGVLGAACIAHETKDVLAVICVLSRHPELLTEIIGLTEEAMDGKEDELDRRLRHPSPTAVKDPPRST